MTRIIFMGTPEFAVPSLEKLIETQEVVGVVTQPDRPAGRGKQLSPPPVKVIAQKAGIPVYQPKSLRSQEAAGPLRAWAPDLIVVAAYGQILRPHVLELPRLGCLNVHASLLPRWRGAAPIHQAILAGDDETGISLMKMDEGLDTGPVYVRQAIPIHPDETAATLHDRLADLGADVLGQALDAIVRGDMDPVAQDEAGATYAPMLKKADGRIDWSASSAQIDRLIRAMTPWPGAFTTWGQRRLKVLSATPAPAKGLAAGTPGLVVTIDQWPAVLTGDGALRFERVQLAGKRAMTGEAFYRGQPDFIGTVLGA